MDNQSAVAFGLLCWGIIALGWLILMWPFSPFLAIITSAFIMLVIIAWAREI